MKKTLFVLSIFSIIFLVALSISLDNFMGEKQEYCAVRDTEIRANPTGYILEHIEEGTPVKLVDTMSPFVWVEYNGILGTVTESHIGKCNG